MPKRKKPLTKDQKRIQELEAVLNNTEVELRLARDAEKDVNALYDDARAKLATTRSELDVMIKKFERVRDHVQSIAENAGGYRNMIDENGKETMPLERQYGRIEGALHQLNLSLFPRDEKLGFAKLYRG